MRHGKLPDTLVLIALMSGEKVEFITCPCCAGQGLLDAQPPGEEMPVCTECADGWKLVIVGFSEIY